MHHLNPDLGRLAGGLAIAALVLTAACARMEAPRDPPAPMLAATLPAGLAPAASVLDLMLDPIDTHADALWEAVAIVSTVEGTTEIKPQSDAEWEALGHKAVTLMEAANLLVIEGRPVGHPGQKIEGPGESTDLTPEQAQAAIDKDRASFVAFAGAMQVAARGLAQAAEARDTEAYLETGSALQEACEGCHRKFWYPNSPYPPGL